MCVSLFVKRNTSAFHLQKSWKQRDFEVEKVLGKKGMKKRGEEKGGGIGVKLPLCYLCVYVPLLSNGKLSTSSLHTNVVVSIIMWLHCFDVIFGISRV